MKNNIIVIIVTITLFVSCSETIQINPDTVASDGRIIIPAIRIDDSNSLILDWRWSTVIPGGVSIRYHYRETIGQTYFEVTRRNVVTNQDIETKIYRDRRLTDIVRRDGKIYSFKVGNTTFLNDREPR